MLVKGENRDKPADIEMIQMGNREELILPIYINLRSHRSTIMPPAFPTRA